MGIFFFIALGSLIVMRFRNKKQLRAQSARMEQTIKKLGIGVMWILLVVAVLAIFILVVTALGGWAFLCAALCIGAAVMAFSSLVSRAVEDGVRRGRS